MANISSFIKNAINWLAKEIELALNWIFALSDKGARNRDFFRWFFFMGIWFYWVYNLYPITVWQEMFQQFIFLVVSRSPEAPSTLVNNLFLTIFHPAVVRHLLALLAPFFLMHRIASIYLADVFEKDQKTARRFVMQAAFGLNYNSIRIREGKIVEADQASQIVQIGGPGFITVELDSAVALERPDGTVRVIGPTIDQYKGRGVIHGFERIRQCVDLRDTSDATSVTARSRDGIMVSAKDIQFSYSINREGKAKSLKTPYPFEEEAIKKQVYNSSIRMVKPGMPAERKPDWKQTLPSKIAGQVSDQVVAFINGRGLSEFLSTIGTPEEDARRAREEQINQMSQKLSGRSNDLPGVDPSLTPGPFTPRSELTRAFHDENGFKKVLANGKGIQINWIGVGTWETPNEIIPSNHLEAWKLSRENISRGNNNVLNGLRNESRMQEHLHLIQDMPISKFYAGKEHPDEKVIDDLLEEYAERLENARELYERDGTPPQSLLDAIRMLNEIRGMPNHWVGAG